MAIVVSLVTVFAIRAWESQRGPPLELRHTYVPRDVIAGKI